MPKSPDCHRCKKQIVIPDATTEKEFVKQARRVWHSAHPNKPVGRPQVLPATVRGIAKMLAKGFDIPTIRETFPSVSKTTADRIRTDYRALSLTIPDGHRMEDGYVRNKEWKAALRRARGIRPEWREPIILGIADTILFDDLIDPIDPANPFAP